MTVQIQNNQIFRQIGLKREEPQNLNDVVRLVREYNDDNSLKISIFNKPISPKYEFSAENTEIRVKLENYCLTLEQTYSIIITRYFIIDFKLFMISLEQQELLKNVFSDDPFVIANALNSISETNISECDKRSFLGHLDRLIATKFSKDNVALKIELYEYQKKGVEWLECMYSQSNGALLADDMGLGKTAQVIGFFTKGIQKGKIRRVLILVPNSLLANWAREITKFTNGLDAYLHWGATRCGFSQQLENENIIITTYSTLVNDLSLFQEFEFDLVVCDEASLLKNSRSTRTQSINALRYSFAILITGTPFENALSDLWSITNIIEKNFLGEEATFHQKYGKVPLSDLDQSTISAIESKVEKVMMRRLKEEVLDDLPDKIDIYTALTPTEREREIYTSIVDEIRTSADEKALALISHLRKFTAHPSLYDGRILLSSFDELCERSAKFKHMATIFGEIALKKEKMLVFANHRNLLTAMCREFEANFSVPCFKIDGSIDIGARQGVIDQFQQVQGSSILFLNPITAGMGLNITAANHVVHYSRQWNPALEAQATARSFRNGQTKEVNAYYLYYANTIEEVIHERINLKSDISSSLIKATSERIDDEYYLRILGEK